MILSLNRSVVPIAALTVAILACSLGASESAAPPTQSGGGGLPIAKGTPTKSSKEIVPTKSAPEPSAPPQPTLAPTSPPPQQGEGEAPITVTNLNVVSPNDAPKIIGIVQNTSDINMRELRLTLSFKDANGNVAATERGTTWLVTLPPGEITPFEFFIPQGVPATAESVAVAVEWREADAETQKSWTREGIDLLNVKGEWGEYYYTITGDAVNNTGRAARSVFLTSMAFNAEGRLIGISTQYIDDLAAGAQAPFEILMAPTSMAEDNLDHFELLVEALLAD